MSDNIRILRVLEYSGPRERVLADLTRRGVKGTVTWGAPGNEIVIREAFMCPMFPEVLTETSPSNYTRYPDDKKD